MFVSVFINSAAVCPLPIMSHLYFTTFLKCIDGGKN